MKKLIIPFIFILWLVGILATFYVFQTPVMLTILPGLQHLALVLLVPLLMTALSACMGTVFLKNNGPIDRLILGTAIGMGIFGMAGFALAITNMATPPVLIAILLTLSIYFLFTGEFTRVWEDLKFTAKELSASAAQVSSWIPISALIAGGLGILMSLAPPIEDFDALLYHLAVPEWWLRDGGLIPSPALPYWYPHLIEGIFVFPISLGVDTSTHLLHFLWLVLTAGIVWHWARQTWGNTVAWNTIAIVLTMPSLLWLASWAYNDYALTFTGIACIYALWKWKELEDQKWITIAGVMAGMAMGIKYTSFFIPLVGIVLIILWERKNTLRIKMIFQLSIIAAIAASPWYIRNWIWTSNPVFPFLFPSRFWDSFLAQQSSAPGSGIGFDLGALILLPLTATLGSQDKNYFDGRFGPLFLILLPVMIWAFWRTQQEKDQQKRALQAIGIFSLIGITIWVFGVINSKDLFIARYLFPVLIPAAIPLALGINVFDRLDTSKLKISFIFRVFLFFMIFVNLFDFGLQVISRNPLAAITSIIPRREYIEARQPGYANALELVESLPRDSKVYFLFEPRSYGMKVFSEPDILIANFQHDLWLYQSPKAMIAVWKQQGFTHVLISNTGADFMFQNEATSSPQNSAFIELKEILLKVKTAPDGTFTLYQIP